MHACTRVVIVAVLLLVAGRAWPQGKDYPLQSADGLVLHNVAVEPVTLQGKKGVRVTSKTRDQAPVEQLARIKDLEFSNGVIEVELAGAPAPDVSSSEALKRTLLAAKTIAYSASVSGQYLTTELYQRLGIADECLPKSRFVGGGERTGAVVARGEDVADRHRAHEAADVGDENAVGAAVH